MKLDNIPDTLYVLIALIVVAVTFSITRETAMVTLLEISIGGLIGLAKGRSTPIANPLPVKEVEP